MHIIAIQIINLVIHPKFKILEENITKKHQKFLYLQNHCQIQSPLLQVMTKQL